MKNKKLKLLTRHKTTAHCVCSDALNARPFARRQWYMNLILARGNIILVSFAWISCFIYANHLIKSKDPRFLDLELNFTEMFWLERLFFIHIFISTICLIFCSVRIAFKNKKNAQMFLSLMFWPMSFYFVWKYRNVENSNH